MRWLVYNSQQTEPPGMDAKKLLDALANNPAALQAALAALPPEEIDALGAAAQSQTLTIAPINPAPVPLPAPRGMRRARGADNASDPDVSLDVVLIKLWLVSEHKPITKKRFYQALMSTIERVRSEPEQQLDKLMNALAVIALQGVNEPQLLGSYTSKHYKRRLAEALTQAGVAQPQIQSGEEMSLREIEYTVVDSEEDEDLDGSSSALEGGSEEEAETQGIFLGFSPTLPAPEDPRELKTAYQLITHPVHGFRRAICFDLVPVLRRVYQNVVAGKELTAVSGRALDPQDTQLMLGGGRCQSQKTVRPHLSSPRSYSHPMPAQAIDAHLVNTTHP